MALLDFFLACKKQTANIAKERLQIIVAEHRHRDKEPPYLPDLKRDILAVICKYIQSDPKILHVNFEQKKDDISVLELNITLPDPGDAKKSK
ncbi:cell division topological specificity factor MinE [Candidatus Gillettellia adelgis]